MLTNKQKFIERVKVAQVEAETSKQWQSNIEYQAFTFSVNCTVMPPSGDEYKILWRRFKTTPLGSRFVSGGLVRGDREDVIRRLERIIDRGLSDTKRRNRAKEIFAKMASDEKED